MLFRSVASVIGKDFPEPLLAAVAELPADELKAAQAVLEGLGVTVVHGDEDRLVPPERGRRISLAIPGAELVMMRACGHLLTTDDETGTASVVAGTLRLGSGASDERLVSDAQGPRDPQRPDDGRSPPRPPGWRCS